MTFTYQRGETIVIALDAVNGDQGTVTTVTAKLVSTLGGDAVDLTVTDRAASGDDPAGWDCSLDAAASADLACGGYRADARLVSGSGVTITDPVGVRIVEAASSG